MKILSTLLLLSFFNMNCSKATKKEISDSRSQELEEVSSLPPSNSGTNIINLLKYKYCLDDGYNEMTVLFRVNKDTAYVYYSNIVNDGKFLNDFDTEDEEDYAGKFYIGNKAEKQCFNFDLLNYRSPDFVYKLDLCFEPDSKKMLWNINEEGPVGYLPKKGAFLQCGLSNVFSK